MHKIMLVTLVGVAFGFAACSKPTQEKTSSDIKAAGTQIGQAAKEVVATPQMKAVGADIKQGAAEAADKTKVAAADAGEKLKAAGSDLKAGAKKAGNDVKADADKAEDGAVSTTTTTVTVTKKN